MKQQQLRITILGLNYSPEPTGNAPYTASLAEGLAALGHDVMVVTGYPHYPEWKLKSGYTGWTREEVINGVRVRRLRHTIPATPSTLLRLFMELTFGVRAVTTNWGNPDVVLVVSPALFSSALAILRCRLGRRRPPVGIWVQDLYSRGVVETNSGSQSVAGVMHHIERAILNSTDGVVAIHDRFRQFMVDSLQVPATKIRVIRNWTHLPAAPVGGQEAMRKKMGWEPGDIVVLHAGNMGRKQGLENVVAAARVAHERDSRVRFVLMGDGNQRQHLEEISAGVGHVEFVDPLPGDEFQMALVAADILLVNELPGVKDMAVPSKLTSYFNAGVPVIAATDQGSVTASEIAASQGGIRVNAADPEGLVDAAESLGQDSVRVAQLGANGLSFRYDTLGESFAVGHYNDFIASLASSRSR